MQGRALLTLLLLALAGPSQGVELQGCGQDGVMEISVTRPATNLTCHAFSHSDVIQWSLHPSSGTTIVIGRCHSNGTCSYEDNRPDFVTLSRDPADATRSIMTLNDVKSPVEGGVNVTCAVQGAADRAASCTLDVVYPAEVASCNAQTVSSSWTADVQCDVTKVKSSLNRYQCIWYRGTSEDSQTSYLATTTFTPRPHSDTDYRQGSCTLTSDLVAKGAVYYYKAVVYPGGTESITRPVVLVEPHRPVIQCSPDHWSRDSSQLTCTCSTQFTGQPAGRLQFFRGGQGVLVSGGYGDLSLDMPPQNVTESELGSNAAFFSCLVQWVANSPRDLHKVTLDESSDVPVVLGLTVGVLGALLLLTLLAVLVGCCFWSRRRQRQARRRRLEEGSRFHKHLT